LYPFGASKRTEDGRLARAETANMIIGTMMKKTTIKATRRGDENSWYLWKIPPSERVELSGGAYVESNSEDGEN